MDKQPNRPTDWRAVSALVMLLSLGFLVATGLLLHVALHRPEAKHVPGELSSAHLGMAALFVLGAVTHVAINRRAVVRHMVAANPGQGIIRKELVLALFLVIGVLVLTVLHAAISL